MLSLCDAIAETSSIHIPNLKVERDDILEDDAEANSGGVDGDFWCC